MGNWRNFGSGQVIRYQLEKPKEAVEIILVRLVKEMERWKRVSDFAKLTKGFALCRTTNRTAQVSQLRQEDSVMYTLLTAKELY